MSTGFEIADGRTVLSFDADTSEALIIMSIEDGEDDPGFGGDFTGDQLRQLRRFLEYCYPASEDPPHDPDPWEAKSGGVPNSGTTVTIPVRIPGLLGGPGFLVTDDPTFESIKGTGESIDFWPHSDEAPGGEG